MIWVILATVGVVLWLCVLGITASLVRNRALRARAGNVPVFVLRPGKKRWVRGNGVWMHDVFAFRGRPATWKEELTWVSEVSMRAPTVHESAGWRWLRDDPVVAMLKPAEASDGTIEVAARGEHRYLLTGPFMALPAGVATRQED